MNNFKKFHYITLFTLLMLMSGNRASAQTVGNKLPISKIKTADNRELKTRYDTINFSDTYTKFSHFSSRDMLITLNVPKYDGGLIGSIEIGTYEHEWNHYKNHMFGVRTQGLKTEETFLLQFYNELTSCCVSDLINRKSLLQDIIVSGESFLKDTSIMEKGYDKWLTSIFISKDVVTNKTIAVNMIKDGPSKEELETIIKLRINYLLNSKKYTKQFIENASGILAKSTKFKKINHDGVFEEILRNMFVLYFDNQELDLLKNNMFDFVLKMNRELLATPKVLDMISQIKDKSVEYRQIINKLDKSDKEFKRAKHKIEKKFKKEQYLKNKEIVRLKKQIDKLKNNTLE